MKPTLTKIMISFACVTLLAACSEPSVDDYRKSLTNTPLNQIEPIELDRQSTTRPISPIEAASRVATTPTTQSLVPQTRPAAATTVRLSLEDVRAAALANNLDLQVALVDPAIAQQDVNAERAKFESTFNLGGSFSRQDTSTDRTDLQVYTAGFDVPLRTGGTVSVQAPVSRSEDGVDNHAAAVQLSISQPLLRNAGVRANEYSIRLTEYQKQIVDSQTKLAAIRILANAERAYWLLYAARQSLDVNQRVYELARKQVDQAQKRFAAQSSPRIEVTRAESGAASQLESILISQTTVRQRERDLKRIMHRKDIPIDSTTEIIPTTEPNPLGLVLSPQALVERALRDRMELLQLELQLAADAETIDFEKNQALPLFALDYNYSLSRNAPHFNDSLELTRPDSATDWSVGLRAEIPIGNAAARAHVHRAILERLQRLGSREQRQVAIQQEVYDTLDELKQDWQRILAAENESILAGRTYEAEQRQFELGVRTSTDVLDAATRHATAQLREVQAITDYQISRVDIAFATGTLLGESRIQLPAANGSPPPEHAGR